MLPAGVITSFAYDASGSFRAWRDLVAERRRAGLGGGKGRLAAFLASRDAGADLAEELQEEFRRELRHMSGISVLDVVAVATALRFDRSGCCGTWPISRARSADIRPDLRCRRIMISVRARRENASLSIRRSRRFRNPGQIAHR
jgi:hypothetical protein